MPKQLQLYSTRQIILNDATVVCNDLLQHLIIENNKLQIIQLCINNALIMQIEFVTEVDILSILYIYLYTYKCKWLINQFNS